MRDEDTEKSKLPFAAFAVLHLVCCGIPLLLLSGMSLAFLVPSWPVAGAVLAVLGVVGFIWYLKRGCATCPRNEGRCAPGAACSRNVNAEKDTDKDTPS